MVAKKELLKLLLWIFFLFLNLQMLSLNGWLTLYGAKGSLLDMIKLYHVVSFILLIFFFRKGHFFSPKLPNFIWHYFILVFAFSAVLNFFYGFNSFIINYLFCFYTLLIGLLVKEYLTLEEIISIFKQISLVIFVIVFFKLIYYSEELLRFIREPWGHPDVETLYGGGVNLEATWLAFNSAFFMNSKKRYFYTFMAFTLLVGLLYASRVGVVLTLLIYFFRFISPAVTHKERVWVFKAVLAVLIIFIFYIDYSKLTEKLYGLERFAHFNSSQDRGMAGRKAMWQYFPQALKESNWFGYGAGNSMKALEDIGNIDFEEDNPHNYYMQLSLEFGIVMLFVYLLLVYNLVRIFWKKKFSDSFSVILIAYFIGSLIQFRGVEPLIWLYIGILLYSEYQSGTSIPKILNYKND